MEQNYKCQQELQYQGFQQTEIDVETPYEAEQRYERFLQEEMNRQALLPKHLESSASRASQRNEYNYEPSTYSVGDWVIYCFCGIFIFMLSVVLWAVFSGQPVEKN